MGTTLRSMLGRALKNLDSWRMVYTNLWTARRSDIHPGWQRQRQLISSKAPEIAAHGRENNVLSTSTASFSFFFDNSVHANTVALVSLSYKILYNPNPPFHPQRPKQPLLPLPPTSPPIIPISRSLGRDFVVLAMKRSDSSVQGQASAAE
jgi:hypothetical protein